MTNQRRAFGERLRRHREKQNVSLQAIAASTKVAASLFAGLERGDCSRWPGGMYNRSFIRTYAAAVRLNPDETAAEFAECYDPAPGAAPHPPVAFPQNPPHPPGPALRLHMDPVELRWRPARRAALVASDVAGFFARLRTCVTPSRSPEPRVRRSGKGQPA